MKIDLTYLRDFVQADLVFLFFFLYFAYVSMVLFKKRSFYSEKYSPWDRVAGFLFAFFCTGFAIAYMQFIGVDNGFIWFFLIYQLNFFGIADSRYYGFKMW
jgi:hypothetical protein